MNANLQNINLFWMVEQIVTFVVLKTNFMRLERFMFTKTSLYILQMITLKPHTVVQ